ncbi:MAG: T9SS type A sorting domain-containing protein, partial [Bacteroidales bacterium]|nr:T9SS type A sorting domain-containing protein [Bacteroidales bacterium]
DQDEVINLSGSYLIYPNPTKGKFYIKADNPEYIQQIILYDIRGNLVESYQVVDKFPMEIDLTKHTLGTYLLIVKEASGTQEFKVIYTN